MEVIPSINCPDVDCARARIAALRGKAAWVHLDVADARFTFNKTWGDPLSWPLFGKDFQLEAHLMVEEPKLEVEGWLNAGAQRVIVHVEAIENARFNSRAEKPISVAYALRERCAHAGAELMLGINPETAPERLAPYLGFIKKFLVLAVAPGPAGQTFLPVSLYTIEWLRRETPHAIIEVDGGINLDTARQAKTAGADAVVSASFLFKHLEGITRAMEILTKI